MSSQTQSVRRLPVTARPLIILVLVALLAALATAALRPAQAHAAAPWWHIAVEPSPSNLPPEGTGQVIVVFSNLGDAPIDGSITPVVMKDVLPAGLAATGITGITKNGTPTECSLGTLSCSFKGVLYPYEAITIAIEVAVQEPHGTATELLDQASVEGGGGASVTRALPVPVTDAPPAFGLSGYELAPFNEDGSPADQAGSHPFELTTTLVMNQIARQPVQLPRDFRFHLPPGLVGNPSAASQCTMANFFALVEQTNLCSPASVVGVATVTVNEPLIARTFPRTVPVFNLVPAQGEPARFGFEVIGKVPIVIDTSVRSGGDYGVDVSVAAATETAGLLSSQVTFWGVPGDPRHDNARGWECVAGGSYAGQIRKSCPASSGLEEKSFLTLPSSCTAEPVVSSVDADSWSVPGSFVTSTYEWLGAEGERLGFTGCGELPFTPSVAATPDVHSAATPTGLNVDVGVPDAGLLDPHALAQADVRDTTVTLPPGVKLSPSAANGLVGCPEGPAGGFEGVGFTGFAKFRADEATPATATFTQSFRFSEEEHEGGGKLLPSCPDGSKLGAVEVETPLLANKLKGYVYLAEPAPNGEGGKNPFNSLVALYIVARDPVSGVLVKLAGEGQLDEKTLRVATTFRNTPEVPFRNLHIHLFGGPRASVTTPSKCGVSATEGLFTPWSGTGPVSVSSPFEVSSGVGGGPCPGGGALPFAPGFAAFSTNPQAGAFTGFQLELTRPDGDQALSGVGMHLPPGVAAMLSSVELCSEAQAAASACPAGSEIGHATAVAGLGSEPFVQEGGRVFITGPYAGAPFGLEIVTPAKAGPFDLGFITVRSKLFIDPNDASVTIVSDPLPTQIRGIPLQLKRVLVTVDRPGFQFNPTSCDPMSITGTVSGDEETQVPVSQHFQVGGCEGLPFAPKLTANVDGQASRADGTTFRVKLESAGVGQENIRKVNLQLPLELPSRLTTLQKACVAATFEANPAACSEESIIGTATIHTPVLKSPLTGPAYLVSHGGAAFPDVEFVLQGEGITLVLDGKTDIKNGITYSKFETAPDAPFSTFETTLPAGPHSALTAYVNEGNSYSLCGQKLVMPTVITAQNNHVIEQQTAITPIGCGEVKSASAKKLSLAQQLAKALKACRTRYKHDARKRAGCERKAHSLYTAKALAACRKSHKSNKKQRMTCEAQARRKYAARPAGHKKR